MTDNHLNHLNTRVLLLEDTVAISNAKMAFVRSVDEAVNDGRLASAPPPPALASLTVDVAAPLQRSWGFSELTDLLGRVTFSLCFLGSEQIKVDDHREFAIGQWVSWHPMTVDGSAWLVAGRYRDNFHRVHGEWRLARIGFTPEICCPWEVGWGADRISELLAVRG